MDGLHPFLRKNKRESLHDLGMVRILRFNITSTIHKRNKIVKWTLSKVKAFIFAQTHVKTNGVAFLPQNPKKCTVDEWNNISQSGTYLLISFVFEEA